MSLRRQVLDHVMASQTPVTSKQLADKLGARVENVASVLTELWKCKSLKRKSIDREHGRGGRFYEYIHQSKKLDGFESLVLPLAKRASKKSARIDQPVTTASLPQASTIIATVTLPVNGRSITFTVREARQLYEQLSALFIGVGAIQGTGHVAHTAA